MLGTGVVELFADACLSSGREQDKPMMLLQCERSTSASQRLHAFSLDENLGSQ